MSNINKVRYKGKIQAWPSFELQTKDFWDNFETPRHVWISYSKKEDRWIINTFRNPRFDNPGKVEPDYWMEYKDNFDTPEGLLHQIKHMSQKTWFTGAMVSETMDAVNILHEKLTNKQHWKWAYGKETKDQVLRIINDD